MDILNLIEDHINACELDSAWDLIIRYEDIFNKNYDYWNLRGILNLIELKYHEALKCFNKSLVVNDTITNTYYNIAYTYKCMKNITYSALYSGLAKKHSNNELFYNDLNNICDDESIKDYYINVLENVYQMDTLNFKNLSFSNYITSMLGLPCIDSGSNTIHEEKNIEKYFLSTGEYLIGCRNIISVCNYMSSNDNQYKIIIPYTENYVRNIKRLAEEGLDCCYVIINYNSKLKFIYIDNDTMIKVKNKEYIYTIAVSKFNITDSKVLDLIKYIPSEYKNKYKINVVEDNDIDNIIKVPLISPTTISDFNNFSSYPFPELIYNIEISSFVNKLEDTGDYSHKDFIQKMWGIIDADIDNRYKKISEFKKIYEKLQNYNVEKQLDEFYHNKIQNIYNIQIYFMGKDKYNILEKCINSNIKINYISNCDNIISEENSFKILIISEESVENLNITYDFNKTIYYDEFINNLFNDIVENYHKNYDYHYLINSIEDSKNSYVESIVVGSSYPLFGICESYLDKKTIKLALPSQDLYYSYQVARKSIESNKNIKSCLIGIGYYIVNHDLSRGKGEEAIYFVKNVYYPILGDSHNMQLNKDIKFDYDKYDSLTRFIFDINFLYYYLDELVYRNNNGYNNTTQTNSEFIRLGKLSLEDISSEKDKFELGKSRADQHNKLLQYNQTSLEYIEIFREFITYLNESNVEPVVIVFPTTKYYRKYLHKDFKLKLSQIIENSRNEFDFKVIDLNEFDIFEERDFRDVDHLNQLGSMKATILINQEILNSYNNKN